ncbi:MAG: hypothetical protein RLZZ546_386 [Bacteroidota bacterium]|jgi:hypothetical protein
MKKLLTFSLILLANFAFAQPNSEKVSNLRYYLESAKSSIESSKFYSDSSQINRILDSIDLLISKTLISVDQILIIPEENIENEDTLEVAPIEDVSDINLDNSDFSVSNNPMFDKYNPLRKSNTQILIETGINNIHIVNPSNAIDAKLNTGGSWFWNFGIIKRLPVGKNLNVNLGLTYLRYRLKVSNDLILYSPNVNVEHAKFTSFDNINEDPKIRINYITVPLDFEIKLSKSMDITIGGYFGYRLNASQKIKSKLNSEEIESIRQGDYSLNNWMYGAKAGLGFGKFDLFVNYNLSNLFENATIYDYRLFRVGSAWKI